MSAVSVSNVIIEVVNTVWKANAIHEEIILQQSHGGPHYKRHK